MECKYCRKYNGDCGNHFADNNRHINFNIPRESVIDKSGNCNYYEESRSDFQKAWDYLNNLVKNSSFNYEYALIIADKINDQKSDINKLIGYWFNALEDEGCEPFECDDCIQIANKYGYTKENYKAYLRTIC